MNDRDEVMRTVIHRSITKYKKLIDAILILAVTLVVLTGCHRGEVTQDRRPIHIVTTIYAPYDFATQVAGELATVTMLLQPGEDVHSFEPTPQDIIAIENCDIFIYAGGENDVWVETILEGSSNEHMKVIRMVDLVPLYEEDELDSVTGEILEEDEEDGDGEDTEWDEHVWTDPNNAILISQEIAKQCRRVLQDKLSAQELSESLSLLTQQTENYCEELGQLDADIRELIEEANRKIVVFADRFPLRYFVEAYGLKYIAAFPGCSSEAEPSARKVASMIDYIREKEIPVVFKIELSNDNMAKVIAEECGVKVITFYSCHNISKADYEAGENYISLMRKNLKALKEALY